MKKTFLLLMIFLIVLVSCGQKQQKEVLESNVDNTHTEETSESDADNTPTEEIYHARYEEMDVKSLYYYSNHVLTGKVVDYTEPIKDRKHPREYSEVTVEVAEVFKGEYMPGQTVTLKIGRHSLGTLIYFLESKSYITSFLFMSIDDNSSREIQVPSIIFGSMQVFALSESGSIRSNYSGLENEFEKGVLEKIPLNLEMLLQEVYEYKPLVNYLKKKLNTTGVGVLSEAENVFIGEIQPKSDTFERYNRVSGQWVCIGGKVRNIKADWEAPDGTVYDMQLYKVRVKVLNVYKGNYKAGDTVFGYVFMRYGESPSPEYMSEQIFIDGDGFFIKYL